MCLERKKIELAREHALKSFEHYEQTKNVEQIGKALINLAHCDYLLGNYEVAAHSLSTAIDLVKNFEHTLVFAINDYVKILVKLRDFEKAARLIETYSSVASGYPDLFGKLQIMNTRITDDPTFANRISNDSNQSLRIRYFACKCLFDFYAKKGDAETALMYYERARIYSNAKREFFEEEGF